MKKLALAILVVGMFCFNLNAVRSEVISGTIPDWVESGPVLQIGDGSNQVSIWWSIATYNFGYFYGSTYTSDSDVAYASGVSAIEQITDASTYSYTSRSIGLHNDADGNPDGIGDFIVWRHTSTGHYGVLRIDDIVGKGLHTATLNGTWWFQTDGSGNFMPIPEPTTTTLTTLALCLITTRRRR